MNVWSLVCDRREIEKSFCTTFLKSCETVEFLKNIIKGIDMNENMLENMWNGIRFEVDMNERPKSWQLHRNFSSQNDAKTKKKSLWFWHVFYGINIENK